MKPALQWSLIAFFALGSAALGFWLRQTHDGSIPPPPPGLTVVALGESALPLRGRTLDDQPQDLPGAGRWRLINFWASWCPPCVKEMPVLDAYHRSQGPHGVQVIGIALEDPAAARAFLERRPVGFPIFHEPNTRSDTSVRLGNLRGVLPYTVLIDPQGRLVAQYSRPFPDVAAVAEWVAEQQR